MKGDVRGIFFEGLHLIPRPFSPRKKDIQARNKARNKARKNAKEKAFKVRIPCVRFNALTSCIFISLGMSLLMSLLIEMI